MPGSLIGTSVIRVEDPDLLTGHTTFVDSFRIPGLLHLAFVRSPYAHAELGAIDIDGALAVDGVVAVYTAADLQLPRFNLFGVVLHPSIAQPPLAVDRVRYVGEAVAVVVATSKVAAADGAAVVDVDYTPLEAVVDPEDALAPGAPLLFADVDRNLAASLLDDDWTLHDGALDDAEVIVRGRFVNQRLAIMPMEGNAITVVPAIDPADPYVATVHLSTQQPHGFLRLATRSLGLSPDSLRVIAPHVGGGFGGKVGVLAEHFVAIAAALRLARPVAWADTRSEHLLSQPHGRAQVHYIEMGFTRAGRITGMRARVIGDGGAYAGFGGRLAIGPTRLMAQGPYEIPKISFSGAVAVTNTTPTGAYRGAGRPEAAAFLERIMDMAAHELSLDAVDIRRKNLLSSDAFPYTTVTGARYDVGDYRASLDEALDRAGYAELRREQQQRRERADVKQIGIGVSTYVEITAGGSGQEYASVVIEVDGTATVSVGTSGHGQGHATTFGTIAADTLGIDLDNIRYVQSDTALVPRGGGTGGSRSLQLGGSAVLMASREMVVRAREIAARVLEADPADIIVVGDGTLGVAGVPARTVSWADIARHELESSGSPLSVALDQAQGGATFPFGAHVAVVEIDTETGKVELLRHIAVDDCGTVVNPMIVAGQQHGGIASGIGQALFEEFVYDEDGNPLTSTLAEYAMVSAAELPSFETFNTQTPTPLNPLGAKGIGESGTIGSTPAVQSAVVDALTHLGVRHVDMPCTPERVWRAIDAARRAEQSNVPQRDVWTEPPSIFDVLPRDRPVQAAVSEVDV
ncbi:MAG: xanthine dehydrogenase family protein molybdopterin-binding subunit [Acidimicrobiia bacterium]